LNHPGIAAIYGIEEDETTTGLVMELVGGESLARRISQGPQPYKVTIEFARQIAEALEAGHERGVVHGDLTADNIVIAPDGRLRILNFGVAGILAAQDSQIDLASGKREDIRAWGLIVCELLQGRAVEIGGPNWHLIRKAAPKPFSELLRSAVDENHPRQLTHIALARHSIDAIRTYTTNTPQDGRRQRAAVLAIAILATLALLVWRHQESAPASAPDAPTKDAAAQAALTPAPPLVEPQKTLPLDPGVPDVRVSVDFDYAGGIPEAVGGLPLAAGDGGPANAVTLLPRCVAVDDEARIYVSEVGTLTSRVRKVENGIITTIAGIGVGGFSGDGGPAISAQLANPQGLVLDKAGNLYIADYGNMRIRKVTAKGIISTVAGTGLSGFNGDGIPATSANISPEGLALDSSGNIYFAEFGTIRGARIRKITTDGLIHTIAGGERGSTGANGPAASVTFTAPYGVAVDDNANTYVADYGDSRVQKIDSSGVIQTVAGTGVRGFNGDGPALLTHMSPLALAFSPKGDLYIAEASRIRLLTPNGALTTVVGDGVRGSGGDGRQAVQAQISNPRCITIDPRGDLYVVDNGGRVLKVSGGIISIVVGGGRGQGGPSTPLINPRVYRVGNGVTAPQVVQQITPSYTATARAAKVKGRVVLEAIIRLDGAVEITRVVQPLGYGLDESAMAALRDWKFRPGTRPNSQPVDVTMNIVVNFEP
jgi:TonB family protein